MIVGLYKPRKGSRLPTQPLRKVLSFKTEALSTLQINIAAESSKLQIPKIPSFWVTTPCKTGTLGIITVEMYGSWGFRNLVSVGGLGLRDPVIYEGFQHVGRMLGLQVRVSFGIE